MTDLNLLEILNTPKIAVLADRTQVKAGDAKGLGSDLRIPDAVLSQ